MAFPFLQSLAQWFQLRKTAEPKSPLEKRIPYTGRTAAGVYVTPERALQNDVVYAGRRYLSQTVGQLPARIKKNVNGQSQDVNGHRVDRLLNVEPNSEITPYAFRETLTGWAVIHGNGIAEIETDAVGNPVALWPIHPERIRFLRDVDSKELIYEVNNGMGFEKTQLRANEVFHIRGYGDGPVGVSVIEYAAQTIGWARATELFGAAFFGEGLHFGGAVILKDKADDDTIKRIRTELEQSYKGPTRAGRWFIGDADMTFTKTTATPGQSQFIETMQFQVESICRWMGVPPHKVYHLLRMTFNNVEQLSIDVVGDCIVPWAMRWEQEATKKLFGQNRQNLKVKMEVKGLLRGDFKTRQEGLQVMRRNGIINADYWADLEDMPRPGEKAGGQTYIVEGNMTTLDKVGEEVTSAGAGGNVPAAGTKENLNFYITPPLSQSSSSDAEVLAIVAETAHLLSIADARLGVE